jgi:hypothetical protein
MDWSLHSEHFLSDCEGNNVEVNEFATVLLEQGLHPIKAVLSRLTNADGLAELDFYCKKVDNSLESVFE